MSDDKTSLGLTPNVAAALSYVFGFISGIIIFMMEKENRFIRFHAMQSIFLSAIFFVLTVILDFIPFIGWVVIQLLSLVFIICWIIAIIKAAQGVYFKIPLIGDLADKQI